MTKTPETRGQKAAPRRETSQAAPRRGVQSAERGLALLAAMAAAPGPVSLSALAAAAGLGAPHAHRFLASYGRAGLVVQDTATARYDLGPLALRLGLAALQRSDPIADARAALPALVEATGFTAILVVWSERGPTIVHWQRNAPAFVSALALGSLLPPTRSASGLVLLAGMAPRAAARVLAAQHRGRADRAAAAQAVRAVQEAREQGWAQVSGSAIPGLAAVAAPLRDAQGSVLAAVTLVGPADGPPAPHRLRLQAFCAEVSAAAPGQPTA